MKSGSRSCRVMLNYRLISVSTTTLYVLIRIHVKSFNVVYEPCHGGTRLRQMSHGSSGPARACAVLSPEDGKHGFSKTGPIF